MTLRIDSFVTRLLTILIASVVLSISTFAQTSEGPNSGSNFSNEVFFGSSASWTNVDSAGLSDDKRVTISGVLGTNGAYTDAFQALDFGFSLPLNSTVNGIIVEIERSDINNAKDNGVWIIKGGSAGSEDKSLTPAWSAETYAVYGSSTDLWSEGWFPQDINATDFGVALSVKKQGGGANPLPKIDHIRITVHYTEWVLPIELVEFDAEMLFNAVYLNWETATEVNNDYFTIERSRDNKHWDAIDTIDGAGNSNLSLKYQAIDPNPLKGVSYYRLKQTDFDGSSKTFETETKMVKNGAVDQGKVKIFPNPSNGIVNFKEIEENWEDILITDVVGKSVKQQIELLQNDAFNRSMQLDFSALNNGLYVVHLKDGKKLVLKK